MNKLIKWEPDQIRATFPSHVPNLIVVESTTPEGAPVTIGTIVRNKHGRVNFTGPAFGFYAGGKSARDIAKYAKRFDVERDASTRVFIVRGQVQELAPFAWERS